MAGCGDAVGPSCSMVDSYGPTVWEHPGNTAPLGFNDMNVHNPLSMLKSGLFLPGMLPHSLSTDSAFIEGAARFSSFSGEHFVDMLNPLGIHQSSNPYVRGGAMMLIKPWLVDIEGSLGETSKDVPLPPEQGTTEGSSPMLERSHDEAKQGVSMSGLDSDEPEFSGGVAQEEEKKKGVIRMLSKPLELSKEELFRKSTKG